MGAQREEPPSETTSRLPKLWGRDGPRVPDVATGPVPGHRTPLGCSKLRALGWERTVPFDEGLRRTVDWFRANRAWWEAIKSGEAYAEYAARNYADR